VVIKKNIGNAVKRNYSKRLVKEFIRKNINIFCKYNKMVFLYNFKGTVNYKDLDADFKKNLNFS
jgi:ribonuclease P protein component